MLQAGQTSFGAGAITPFCLARHRACRAAFVGSGFTFASGLLDFSPNVAHPSRSTDSVRSYPIPNCITYMGWLRFGLELEDELTVETAVRAIRSSDDTEALRAVAEDCYRSWVIQSDIARQLMLQLADAEQRLALYEPLPSHYLAWAQEITTAFGVEQPDPEPQPAHRSWFRRLWPNARGDHQSTTA